MEKATKVLLRDGGPDMAPFPAMTQIALFSRWKLKNGFPPELAASVEQLPAAVRAQEPKTLVFSVHVPAADPPPIGPSPEYEVRRDLFEPSESVPTELVFFEVYKDAEAFRDHLRGPFQSWLTDNRDFLQMQWTGRARPETTYLDPSSIWVRSALVSDGA